jgi:hypothetical protein
MKMKKSDILAAFKADMIAADPLRLDMLSDVEKWRSEYDGNPYGNEEKGKSSFVSRDIKRQDEWQHASIKDPFVSQSDIVTCNPVTFEDRKAAEQNQLVLNYQFTRQFNRYAFMTDVIKLNYSEGTVVVKTSWEYLDEEIEVPVPQYMRDPMTGQQIQIGEVLTKQLKVLENRPHAEVCRLEDIYIDPTCKGDLTKAQFVIHRYESDLSSLRTAGKYKNLDKLSKGASFTDTDYQATSDRLDSEVVQFRFKDEPRKKLVVYEYWGFFDVEDTGIVKPVICAWVDDTIIQFESNPYPDDAIPFLLLKNNAKPFKLYGESDAELVGDNQKISTAIKRGVIDNMANSNNAQKGIKKGALDPLNKKRFFNNKNFEYNNNTATDFFEGGYNQIPSSVFSFLTMMNDETEAMLGVKSFSGGINGNQLGSTATASKGVLDAVSVRRMDIVRNISENLIKPLLRKWMSYNSEFLREEEIVRITNDEFVAIRRDDLKGNIDIQIEVTTAEDSSAKAQELSMMLQTIGPQVQPEMLNILMSQFFKLHKMPDLAKMIEEYQPQPDPMQQEMKALELQKMKAEIAERMSRTTENETDKRLKNAKAVLEEAKAEGINSDTDLKDLDFLRKSSGEEFNEKMSEKVLDKELAGNTGG